MSALPQKSDITDFMSARPSNFQLASRDLVCFKECLNLSEQLRQLASFGSHLRAFLFPFGGPGDLPPCIRQRPFFIAGDSHSVPLLVRARHRGDRCISKSMGLFL